LTEDRPGGILGAELTAEGIEEMMTIPNAMFVGKPINTRTFAKEVRMFMKKKAR
jgi:hypothetical protein